MSLPAKQRIRRPAEFRQVFARGRRASNALTSVVVVPNDLDHLRLGLSVSKRVGGAVKRNQVKRRIRSVIANVSAASGWDVVVTARPESASASQAEIGTALEKSMRRAGVDLLESDSASSTNEQEVV